MRIESIRFKNLNSLKGEWAIDLTHDAYAQTGLFAITGPTGAGKTTILDAIAMALYGETPRLSTVSKSENELMTRGTGDAMTEITFSAGGRRCRARWAQRRAYGKENGQLQPPQVELWEETADGKWQGLADQKRTFDAEILRLTGMNFEQFQRTMLLAQGNFAAFLKAESDDRAAMLEHITGTEIYTEISKAVHERHAAEKAALDELQTTLAASGTMAPEERQAVEAEARAKSHEAEQLAKDHEALKAVLTQHERHAALAQKLAANASDIARTEAEQIEQAPLAAKLEAARRAQTLLADAEPVKAARRAVAEREKEAPVLAARKKNAQAAVVAAQAMLAASTKKKEAAQTAYEALLQLTPKVRALDRELPQLAVDAKKKADATAEAESLAKKLATDLQANAANRANVKASLAALQAAQEKAQGDAAIADALPAVSAALVTWESAASGAAAAQEKLAALQKKLAASQKAMATLAPDIDKATAARDAAQTALNAALAKRAEALAGDATADLQTKASEFTAREAALTTLLADTRTLAETQAKIAADRQTLDKEAARQAALEAQKKHADEAIDLCASTQETLQRQIEALTEIEKLAALRASLQDGSPCPLCGALHHPFTEHRPDTDVTGPAARLKEEKAKGKALAKTVKTVTEALSDAAAQVKTLAAAIAVAEPAAQKAAADLAARAQALALSADHFADAAEAERQKAAEQAAQLRKRLADAAAAQDEAAQHQNTLNAAEGKLQTLTHRRTTLAAQQDAAQEEAAEATRSLTEAQGALAKAAADFAECTAPFGAPASTVAAAQERANDLARRAKTFAQNADALRRLTADDQLLTETARQLAARQADADKTVSCARADDKAAQAALQEKTAQRQTLFGDKSPDAEEAAARGARARTDDDFLKAQAAEQTARQTLTLDEGLVARNAEETAAARRALEAAEPVWAAALQAKGFADEAAWQAAVMTPDAIADAEKQLKTTADRLTGLQEVRKTLTQEKDAIAQKLQDAESADVLKARASDIARARSEADKAAGACAERLKHDDEVRRKNEALAQQIDRQTDTTNLWAKLKNLIGSADGKKYREFVQGLTFGHLIDLANESLVKLTDRYTLEADKTSPLTLNVQDHYRAGCTRSAKNLSGGESFIVSLALALGLSRLSGRNVHVDSLFLDEGFGTLDEEALDTALSVLASLNSEGKLIGIISHVGQIKERIPARIEVTPQSGGVSTLAGPGVTAK